jgi:hypothetical protein
VLESVIQNLVSVESGGGFRDTLVTGDLYVGFTCRGG